MKPINNWNNVEAMTDRPKLPAGGYVCKIMGAKVRTFSGSNGEFEKLEVSMDIYEGEHSGFFADDYRAKDYEDKKWGCVYRLTIPTEDGSDQDTKNKRRFKTFINAVEDSNPGYHWDWDENKLKDKVIGFLFRRREWEWNGTTGWKTEPYVPKDADIIREEKYTVPNDLPLAKAGGSYAGTSTPSAAASGNNSFAVIDSDDDLPF